MSTRYPGGFITRNPVAPTSASASGIWTQDQVLQYVRSGTWPQVYVPIYIEDVFSTYLWTGTDATQTITNGIDLSTKGGLVWMKRRDAAGDHGLFDTVRGSNRLISNSTAAQVVNTQISSFNTNGFTLSGGGDYNSLFGGVGETAVGWTFREQAKFFDVVTYTGNGANRTIAHNLGSVPGCIIVKSTSYAYAWRVYHRSLGNTKFLTLNTTDAEDTGSTLWNNTTPTATEFTVGTASSVNANGDTFVAYLFAHDAGGFGPTGTDNVISCGSFSGAQTISLGYEPQWVLVKGSDTATNWQIEDNMRGLTADGTGSKQLYPNLSNAEANASDIKLNATGFSTTSAWAGITGIYIAIRRGPMKTPTSGTSVFSPVARTGTSAAATMTAGFAPDAVFLSNRNRSATNYNPFYDKLRGNNAILSSNNTGAEQDLSGSITQYTNTGITLGSDAFGNINASGGTYINWIFQRAPGFFDVVCYTGTGANMTIAHNLKAAPELIIIKKRSAAGDNWPAYICGASTFTSMYLNSTQVTGGNAGVNLSYGGGNALSSAPTSSNFYLQNDAAQTTNAATFVTYLFATVAGVSKVGSYTGTGTTLQVDCGFTAGSRFVMIKRTDSTGDWYVWDSARGIVAGDDPYLLLNSTAAEVTNTDYVDTSNAGFEISSTAPAAINANGGTYIFLAIA